MSNKDQPSLMDLVDDYAEARHTQGHSTYNAKTAAARQRVVDYIESLGAGGISPLRRQCLVQISDPATQWISVKDRLPAMNELVLLATEFFGPGDWRIKAGGRNSGMPGGWQVFGASWTPSHWMPMPLPPSTPGVSDG